eukprot:6187886-Pleurochrysis_carterae.AAC.1
MCVCACACIRVDCADCAHLRTDGRALRSVASAAQRLVGAVDEVLARREGPRQRVALQLHVGAEVADRAHVRIPRVRERGREEGGG